MAAPEFSHANFHTTLSLGLCTREEVPVERLGKADMPWRRAAARWADVRQTLRSLWIESRIAHLCIW
jgi:hypothetical protein